MRVLLFLMLLFGGYSLAGQSYESRIHYKVTIGDTTQLHQLILLDYSKFLGTAMEIDEDYIYFKLRSSSDVSEIPLEQLRFLGVFNLNELPSIIRSGAGPGFSDLTYERTALPFHSSAQVKVINLLYAVVEWNLNKNLQVGVGLAGPVGILGTVRYRFSLNKDVHLGLSNQILFPPFAQFDNDLIVVGDVTTMLTFGDERRFLNLGTGIFYNTDDFVESVNIHRLGIGGRVSNRVHLYAEAALLLDNEAFNGRDLNLVPSVNVSIGARRHRWRFGIFSVFLDEDSFVPPPLPYVGYTYYW
ncbi:MAG: hypothetical protein AAGA31_20105 [Bacteroidota bacterium]